MSKEFDWKAFEAELEKSTAICATGKADIKRAISAGTGVLSQPKIGEVWDCHGTAVLMTGPRREVTTGVVVSADYLGSQFSDEPIETWHYQPTQRLAKNLHEYFAAGRFL